MTLPLRPSRAVCGLLLLLAAACGGGSEPTQPITPPPPPPPPPPVAVKVANGTLTLPSGLSAAVLEFAPAGVVDSFTVMSATDTTERPYASHLTKGRTFLYRAALLAPTLKVRVFLNQDVKTAGLTARVVSTATPAGVTTAGTATVSFAP